MKTRYIKRATLYVVLIALLCTCTVGMASSFLYERYTQMELQTYKNNLINTQYAELYRRYGFDDNPQMSELFAEKDSLQRLKDFNHDLNQYFNYYEVFKVQGVDYVEGYYKGSPKFVTGYDRGEDGFMNQKISTAEGFYYLTSIEAVQIGLRAMEDFDLSGKVERGRCFYSEDYVVKTKLKEMPVLLGYEYEEFYELGDQIKVNYIDYPVMLKVIGFLRKESYCPYENSTISLDRMIVMPFVDFLDTPSGKYAEFQKDYYAEKNECRIGFRTDDDTSEMKETFNQLCIKHDMSYIIRFPEDLDKSIKAGQLTVMKSTKKMIRIYSIAFFSIVSLLIMGLMIKNIEINKRKYAIYLISGLSLLRLKTRLFGTLGLIYSMGYSISLLFIWKLMDKMSVHPEFFKTLLVPIGKVYVIIIFLILLMINRYLNRTNFADALRRR